MEFMMENILEVPVPRSIVDEVAPENIPPIAEIESTAGDRVLRP